MKTFLTSIFVSFTLLSIAQTSRTDSSRTIDQVTIFTKLEVEVSLKDKIDIEPTLEEPKANPTTFTYSFPNITFSPKAVYTPIDPVFIKPEPLEDLSDNYIELGGGNYLSSYLDAHVHNKRDKYYTYGLRVRHQAASASNNPSQARFSNNRVTAYGIREKGNTLKGLIDYNRNVVHFYGYDTAQEFKLSDINQIYNDVVAQLNWEKSASRVKSSVDFGFDVFDKLQGNETTVNLVNKNEFKAGRNQFHIDLDLLYTQANQITSYSRFFADFAPHLEFSIKKFDIDAGFVVTPFIDSNTSVFKAAPRIHAQTYLVPDKLKAFLGVTGGLQRSTIKTLVNDNRFLGNDLDIQNPFEIFKVYAGMNGNFKRFVEYGIKLSNSSVQNQALYVTDTNSFRNMQVIYDNVNTFAFTGELKLDINTNLDIGAIISAYTYNTKNQSNAWNLPSYDAKVFSTIRLVEKIYISMAYYAISPRKAVDLKENTFDLKSINDLNLGIEYRYKKNISGFINVHNLLNQEYQLWNYYNAQKINVLAGVTFSL